MVDTNSATEPHDVHSERLMRPAFEQLAKGERVQAGQRAWDAMTHTLKAIAEERRLTYRSEGDGRAVLRSVLKNMADPESGRLMRGGFAAAENLHRDYFGDVHLMEDLDEELDLVRRAITALYGEQERWRKG